MPKTGSIVKSRGGDRLKERASGEFGEGPPTVEGKTKRVKRKKGGRQAADDDDGDEETFVDARTTERILRTAREQKESLERGDEDSDAMSSEGEGGGKAKRKRNIHVSLSDLTKRSLAEGEEEDESEGSDDDSQFEAPVVELDPEEERLLASFVTKSTEQRRTLGEIIQAKIDEKQTEIASVMSDGGTMAIRKLDPRLLEMYYGVRDVLAKYRSGPLPKAFKLIPKLVNWEQIVSLTVPEKWSAAAVYAATRLFASNLNALMCQRFINLILLPRVRDDIAEYKRLNFHLYQALRKALFKPGAFMKGFLLPLCESGECTHREAVIVSSVMARCSIPMLHTAAVIVRISSMSYTGANSIFLRTLIDKKYTLPFQTVDALVTHFVRFTTDERQMPVLWHQCLLALCQRYKEDLTKGEIKQLLKLVKVHHHHQISEEVRRELSHAKVMHLATAKEGDDVPMEI